jgi:hypothetical protein
MTNGKSSRDPSRESGADGERQRKDSKSAACNIEFHENFLGLSNFDPWVI